MPDLKNALVETVRDLFDEMGEKQTLHPGIGRLDATTESGKEMLAAVVIVGIGPEAQRLFNLYQVVYQPGAISEPKRVGESGTVVRLAGKDDDAP
jgi:hypothetical protein